MRLSWIGYTACAVAVMAAVPAPACELVLPTSKVTSYAPDANGGDAVPNIARGHELGVSCSEVQGPDADVRVVMQLDGDALGYRQVLATNQTVKKGNVYVRVPDVAGLADHTVRVKVYVMDQQGTHSCDVGRVHIG